MNRDRLLEKYADFKKAVLRLKEVLELGTQHDYLIDAAIQRFEFTYELCWKLLKGYLEYTGVTEVNNPRAAFKEAFAIGIISNGESWISMIDDRNLTSHTYNEDMAMEIYQRVSQVYFAQFMMVLERLAGELAA